MDEIEFIFQIGAYDSDALLPQVSKALQKRTQVNTQKLKPGVDTSKMTEEQLKQHKRKQILWGFVFLAVGIYLLVSGLMSQGKLTMTGAVGIIAIVLGINRLLPKRQPKVNVERFDKAAREFLDGHKDNLDGKELQVCFSDEEMVIVTGAVEDLDQEAVAYDEIEFAMECEDIFLLVHSTRGVMLQKKDVTLGNIEEFREFLVKHVPTFIPVESEVETKPETVEVPETEEASEEE